MLCFKRVYNSDVYATLIHCVRNDDYLISYNVPLKYQNNYFYIMLKEYLQNDLI